MTRTNKKLPDNELLTMAQSDYSKLHPVAGLIEAKALVNLGRRRDGLLAMEKAWRGYHKAIENGWIPPLSIAEWFVDLHELFKVVPEEGQAFALRLAKGNFTHEQYFGLVIYYRLFGNEFVDTAIDIITNEAADPTLSKQLRWRFLNHLGGYLVEVGRFEESKSVFKQLVEEEKSPLVLNNYAYVVGVYMDNPQEGLRLAKEAALQAPREPSILDTVAVLYERTGDYEKAAEMFDYLLQIDPSNTKAMAKLAILYAENLNQPERGLVFAERARSITPRLPEVLDALGWSYYQTGREEKAEDLLERSLRQGETMDAYIHLAQVVMKRSKFEDALGHLRMAQELADDTYSKNRISALQDDIRNIQATMPE
jgi:tetratricopeptide (TPR) repeat protein